MTSYCVHPDDFDCLYCKGAAYGVKHDDLPFLLYSYWREHGRSYGGPCDDCGGRNEPYTVRNSVWKAAGKRNGLVCLECLEGRLSRRLTAKDFHPTAPINYGAFGFCVRAWLKYREVV